MTRPHRTPSRLARRLRPSPERLAAAAAAYDPRLLLALHAARAGTAAAPRPRRDAAGAPWRAAR